MSNETIGTAPAVVLCDLNVTLSSNFRQVWKAAGSGGMQNGIRVEHYREDMVEWLTEMQRLGWEVHLFTVRRWSGGRRPWRRSPPTPAGSPTGRSSTTPASAGAMPQR